MTGSQRPPIAFSTLGSPNWSLGEVLDAARTHGYAGVELRVLDGKLVDCTLSPEERRRVKRDTDAAGVQICCVDSSIQLAAGGAPAEVAAELAGFLELAREWESSLVRVFPGPWPDGHEKARVLAAMAEILDRALPTAERLGVAIVIETHDTFARATLVGELLGIVANPSFGALWDVYQPHTTGENLDQVFAALGERILHVHIKDARRNRNPEARGGLELVPLGTGELPVRQALDGLRERGYTGWLSVEWPNLWQPELAGPEIVLPQHAAVLREWLATEGCSGLA